MQAAHGLTLEVRSNGAECECPCLMPWRRHFYLFPPRSTQRPIAKSGPCALSQRLLRQQRLLTSRMYLDRLQMTNELFC